jgi:hypothetical protein
MQLFCQIVGLRQFPQGPPLTGGTGLRRAGRQQPATNGQHVDDAEQEHQQADRRDTKKAERLQTGIAQGIVDHKVRRRGDQSQQTAKNLSDKKMSIKVKYFFFEDKLWDTRVT